MNRMSAAPGTSAASAASAPGPCSASSARSVTGSTEIPSASSLRRCSMSWSAQAAFPDQEQVVAPAPVLLAIHQVVGNPALLGS